ncbi:rab proteins geranylgeranyltransferase component A-like [Homarus americanus]|uniref:rab proteins geranylgeranyltransferase component A-like n=1 Tax=Homarus americanus TaxID=6706 RepID=UPI001C45283C|nr:rab proteins geranylgeranyltransferase component A-like [Homarus americanus]
MEAELPTEYDVIVVGTGLVECIVAAASARVGKKVLHIDKNDYYGGQWASFTLRNIEQWVEEHTASHQETKNTEECALEEGEKLAPTSDPRRVYSKVKLSWHAQKAPRPSINNTCSSEDDSKLKSCSDEAPTASEESATKDDSGEGSSEETTTPKAETKDEAKEIKTWSQEEMMQLSRKFNLDLAPKLLFSRGALVELLISSNVARYAEFKCITRVLTWLVNGGDEGSLLVVPCSRSDVFTTSSVSLVEKRLLMKFLEFCHSYDQQPEQLEEYADKPFVDFLKSRKLTDNITHFVTDSIAMVVGDVPCKEGLERMKLFLTSLGRYGTTPFLFSMYGCGELPQAFCRLCAVFEGTYILRRPVSSLIINSGNTCLGLVSEGQRFKCSHLVIDAAYAPQEYAAIGSSPKQPSLSRGIFIIDRSILPNEKEQLTLLRLPAKDGNPQIVTILEVGGGSGVCPKDLYCVHMTCQGYDAEEDLKIAVQRLFGCGATSQPTVLMSLYFNLVDLSACDLVSGAPTNVYLCSGPDTELDYDFAIDQAKNVFTRMFPEEEFLPRAPDPDEIVFDNAGAEPKDGDNFDSNTKMGEKDEATVNPENRTDEEKALAADEVLSSTKEGSS